MPELSFEAKGQWRPMAAADLPGVLAVADRVHPAFPEDGAVFEERLRLYPAGCLAFSSGADVLGYAVSHPWRAFDPPALNARLGELSRRSDTYYIHDVALLPELRGSGAAALVVALLIARARKEGFATVSLVAVNGSAGFWAHHGFHDVAARKVVDAALARKLRGYDDAAAFMVRTL
ncbi:MAG: GNAT family N-acetyltransferase [Xanthobacteraceae bacterium]|nr:GNAT family N-acetyltransferase [Xanthobacteraceae bacterium]